MNDSAKLKRTLFIIQWMPVHLTATFSNCSLRCRHLKWFAERKAPVLELIAAVDKPGYPTGNLIKFPVLRYTKSLPPIRFRSVRPGWRTDQKRM